MNKKPDRKHGLDLVKLKLAIQYHPDLTATYKGPVKQKGTDSQLKLILLCIVQQMNWNDCKLKANLKSLCNDTGIPYGTLRKRLTELRKDEWINVVGTVGETGNKDQNLYILQLKRVTLIKSDNRVHRLYPYKPKQQDQSHQEQIPQQQQIPQQHQEQTPQQQPKKGLYVDFEETPYCPIEEGRKKAETREARRKAGILLRQPNGGWI